MHKFHNMHLDWSVCFADDQQLKEPLISAEAKSDTDSHDSSSVHVSLHQIHRHEEVKLPISQMPDGHSIFSDDHEPASCSCLPPFLFSRVSIGGQKNSMIDFFPLLIIDILVCFLPVDFQQIEKGIFSHLCRIHPGSQGWASATSA